jgi:hypothetical protein
MPCSVCAVAEDDLYVVVVTDHLTPALVSHAGAHYVSPPQDEDRARMLVRVLIGSPQTPTSTGPWARPVAGGRRHIAMRRAAGE